VKFKAVVVSILVAMAANLGAAEAQSPDPRDYEVGYFVPHKTTVINSYLRHQSGTHGRNYSVDAAVFRATYILKYGDLVVTPFDLILPVVDQRAFTPLGSTLASVNPAFSAIPSDLNLTLHASGLGDMIFLPTIGHGITQDKTNHTHTWYALTTYITAPTGQYDPSKLLNVGSNRWTINPLLTVGQRFLRAITLEANINMAFYTDNDEYRVPTPALAGRDLTLKQKASKGAAVHLAVDLHPMFFVGTSYLVNINGRRDFNVPTATGEAMRTETPGNTVHTFRFNMGIRITPQTLLLAQWNEEVAGTPSASLGRFVGLRVSHAFFQPPRAPTTQSVSDAVVPARTPIPKDEPAERPASDEDEEDTEEE
jgi:hypothetical protein